MAVNIDELLPTAQEIQKKAAMQEAGKAEEHAQRLAAGEAEKRALIERLPSRICRYSSGRNAYCTSPRAPLASHRSTRKTCLASATGSGLSAMPSMTVKTAVLTPIPTARVKSANAANPGDLVSDRAA